MTQQQPKRRVGRPPSAVATRQISVKLPETLEQRVAAFLEAMRVKGVALNRSQLIQQALIEYMERAEKGQQRDLL